MLCRAAPRGGQFLGQQTRSPHPDHLLHGLSHLGHIHLPSSAQGHVPDSEGQTLRPEPLAEFTLAIPEAAPLPASPIAPKETTEKALPVFSSPDMPSASPCGPCATPPVAGNL